MQPKEQHFEIKKEYAWFLEQPASEQIRLLELYESRVFRMNPKSAFEFIFNAEIGRHKWRRIQNNPPKWVCLQPGCQCVRTKSYKWTYTTANGSYTNIPKCPVKER